MFLRNFLKSLYYFTFPPAVYYSPKCSTPLSTLEMVLLFNFSHCSGCVWYLTLVLIYSVEYLFLSPFCLLYVFFDKVSVQIFCLFFIEFDYRTFRIFYIF